MRLEVRAWCQKDQTTGLKFAMTINLSLRTRILTLVAGFVLMALAIMLYGLASLSDYSHMMSDYGRAYENAYMGERLNHLITASIMEARGLYLSKSPEDDQMFIGNIERTLGETEDVLEQWKAEKVATPEMQLDKLSERVRAFVKMRYDVLRLTRSQSKAAGQAFGLTYRPERLALQADITRVIGQTRKVLEDTKVRADTYRKERMVTFIVATLLSILVTTVLILWVMSHFITREIARIRDENENREKLLKQLMDTNTELERFAYVASHDLQEPVRMVKIYSELIASDYESKLDDSGREYLGMVTASAARMYVLIQDLLQYSRLQHDQAGSEIISLQGQLQYVKDNLKRLIEDSGAEISADGLPDVPGNPVQIQRLLSNLLANAIKYQPRGQKPVITIRATEALDTWQIDIADNGLGIDPQFSTQIFEPFRRLHTWDQIEGSGMGLAICRKIVERHGGQIWVESEIGRGARFCFTLPKYSSSNSASSNSASFSPVPSNPAPATSTL